VRPVDLLQLLLLSLLWGSAYLFMRAAAPDFGPAPLAFLRIALASLLVMLPLALWRGAFATLAGHRRDVVLFGVVFTALPATVLSWAALSLPAGTIAVLQSCAPMCAALVARVWLGQRIPAPVAAGLALGVAGVVLLVWDEMGLQDPGAPAVLATIAVTLLWGVSSNYEKARLSHVDPIGLAAGSLSVAALALAPWAWATWPASPPTGRDWGEAVYLGIATSGLGFVLYFRLLRRIGSVRTVSVSFLNNIVAMAAAAVYLGEPVTVRMIAGAAVILAGTLLALGLVGAPRPEAGRVPDR
jgi:drug/metabolite transporter (DMT)-like permease